MDATAILREARDRAGLSTRQLARRAGTSHAAVLAYETGRRAPTTTTFERLLRACGFVPDVTLRPVAPFEDRARRGAELIEVLDLADALPSAHGPAIAARFASG